MRSGVVMRSLAGVMLTMALMVGIGAGLFHADAALAGIGSRRADMLAAGVDPMPVGTSKQVERVKQARGQKP